MSSLQLLKISSIQSKATIESQINLQGGGTNCLQSYLNYLAGVNGGQFQATIYVYVGAVQATATLTSTGSASNGETFSLCNVTFTAKTSGATGNQFNISGTPGTQAANIAAAINGSADLNGIVTATALAGVVTVAAVIPGLLGNGLQISESLTNVTATAFAGGADGDTLTITKS